MKEMITFASILGGLIALLWWWTGSPDTATITRDEAVLRSAPPRCLALGVVYPEDARIRQMLEHAYRFDPTCPWRLEVNTKSGIRCTSNQNSDRKALSAFPTSYLRLEVRRGMRLLYTYYIDLTRPARPEDVRKGFARLRKDVGLQ
jgi:hypothetical protein